VSRRRAQVHLSADNPVLAAVREAVTLARSREQ
jgi:hypothetical protein